MKKRGPTIKVYQTEGDKPDVEGVVEYLANRHKSPLDDLFSHLVMYADDPYRWRVWWKKEDQ